VSDWVLSYRNFLEASFSRLDAYLEELQATEQEGGKMAPSSPEATDSDQPDPSRSSKRTKNKGDQIR
jgi:hypothetical protein